MDPLVRWTLRVQELLAKTWGTGVAALLGLALCLMLRFASPPWVFVAWGGLWLLTSGSLLMKRVRLPAGRATAALDAGLLAQVVVMAYATLPKLPGGLGGAYHSLVYVLVLVAAALGSLGPVLVAGSFAVTLEAAWIVSEGKSLVELLPHVGLVLVFGLANRLLLGAEMGRIRLEHRKRIESELIKTKEAARSFRLDGGVAQPVTNPVARDRRQASLEASQPLIDDSQWLQSSVDEIGQALRFALELLKSSLGSETAALLWLDDSKRQLSVREISSSFEQLRPGPFSARDGLCAAALAKQEPVSISGPRAEHHTPYYVSPHPVFAVAAVPVSEQGEPVGVLVVDRERPQPFSLEEERQLVAAAHFILRAIQNERVLLRLERTKREQGQLYRAAGRLAEARSEAQVIEVGVGSAREIASFDFAVVTLYHAETKEHEICAVSSNDTSALLGKRFRHNAGLVSMVVENRHALPYRGDYDEARQVVFTKSLKPPSPMPSLLVLPLLVHGQPLGTLVLGAERKNAFGASVRPTLEVLASHVAVSLENARLLQRLEEMATTDGLTGLLNKRTFTDMARQKLRSAERFKRSLSLLVLDIDFFKKVNDNYGHDVGDRVIASMGEVLRRAKRSIDVVGRFGGEEFVILCEETDHQGAVLLGERVRQEVAGLTWSTPKGTLSVTCSVGVATFPVAGVSWEQLFKAADEALYTSKQRGRDRLTVWSPKLEGCAA